MPVLVSIRLTLIPVHQTKDRALADEETDNQRLIAELHGLQEDLAVQEEELAYQQRELHQLRQRCHQQDTLPHHQGYSQKGEYLMMLHTFTLLLILKDSVPLSIFLY